MQEGGWIRLYRSIRKHWLWEDAEKLKWWIDILLQANHQDRKILIGNELTNIERGSFHTSIMKLSERWLVDRKTVKKFLVLLEKDGMITLKTSKKGTTLKVSNYEGYQANSEGQFPNKVDNSMDKGVDNSMDNSVPIKSQQSGHKQELKNYKNDKEGKEREEESSLPPLSYPTPIHKLAFDNFGEVSYRTWFDGADIKEDGELISITVEEFKKKIVQDRYGPQIALLTGKKVSVKVGEQNG